MTKKDARKQLEDLCGRILTAFDSEKTEQIFLEITVHNFNEAEAAVISLQSSNKIKYNVRPNDE